MPTLRSPASVSLLIQVGEVLEVSAPIGSVATVVDNVSFVPSDTVIGGSSTFGPYSATKMVVVACKAGAISYSYPPAAELSARAAQLPALATPLDRCVGWTGDSRVANAHSGSAPNDIQEAYGFPAWAPLYTNGCVQVVRSLNVAVGGQDSAEWLATLPALIAAAPAAIVSLISTNDRGSANYDLVTSKTNIETGMRMIMDAGIISVLVAELPRGGANALTGTQLQNHLDLRDWMLLEMPKIGVLVADPYSEMVDPAAALPNTPKAGLLHDGLHPSPAGARMIMKHVARQLNQIFVYPMQLAKFAAAYNATSCPTGQLTANPLMSGTTGTKSAGANATGSVADSWALVGSSFTGGTVAVSKEVAPIGSYQVFAPGGTPTSASSYIAIEQTLTLANVVSGDKIRLAGQVVTEGLRGIAGVSLDIRFVRGGVTSYVKACDRYLETTPLDGEYLAGPMETPILTLDGTETEIKARFVIYGCQNMALGGVIKVAQLATSKVL